LHLAMDLLRFIRVRGENKNHYATLIYSFDYRSGPFGAGRNISWRDPAPDAFHLKCCARGVCYRFVLMRVADEYVKSHD